MGVDYPVPMPSANMIVNLATLAAVSLHAVSAAARLKEAARHSAILAAMVSGGNGNPNQLSQQEERLLTLKTAGTVTMNFATPYILMILQKVYLHRFISKADMLVLMYFLVPVAQLLLIFDENHQLFERLRTWCGKVLISGRNRVEPIGRVHLISVPIDDVVVIELEEI